MYTMNGKLHKMINLMTKYSPKQKITVMMERGTLSVKHQLSTQTEY